jgi:hypothetical protein
MRSLFRQSTSVQATTNESDVHIIMVDELQHDLEESPVAPHDPTSIVSEQLDLVYNSDQPQSTSSSDVEPIEGLRENNNSIH